MFTGIIKEIGIIENVKENLTGKEITIKCPEMVLKLTPNDSVAVDGVCQTVAQIKKDCFIVQAVHTTLKKTTLGDLKIKDEVNLELPMTLSEPLGGHLVQGHVNGVAVLFKMDFKGGNKNLIFEIPMNLCAYIIKEGSIAINGISLTVAEIHENKIMVSIIPHTWTKTNLRNIKIGSRVNLEVDVIAKYVESFLLNKEKKIKVKDVQI